MAATIGAGEGIASVRRTAPRPTRAALTHRLIMIAERSSLLEVARDIQDQLDVLAGEDLVDEPQVAGTERTVTPLARSSLSGKLIVDVVGWAIEALVSAT